MDAIRAYRRIAARLPALTGPDWPRLERLLGTLLARHANGELPTAAVEALIRAELAAYPEAYRELLRAVGEPAPDIRRGDLTAEPDLAAPTAPRWVNLALLRQADYRLVPTAIALAPGQRYLLRVDIGRRSPDSVVEPDGQKAFPELPRSRDGHWLEIAVTSADFAVPEDTVALFLPTTGQSWICACEPGARHTCDARSREPYALVPVTAPDREGSARLRVALWFRRNVVQSLALDADVVAGEAPPGRISAAVDYTLTDGLADVAALEPRELGVLVNESAGGTHTLAFNGGAGAVLTFSFTEGALTQAMGRYRDALLAVHEERRNNFRGNRLGSHNEKSPADFKHDLEQLARLGWGSWSDLFRQQQLQLRAPGVGGAETIHVARVQNSLFVFPWAGVYDIPLDTAQDARLEPCPLVAQWDGTEPLVTGAPRRCPHEADHASKNTLCPFGFWGFRYGIEQPPSTLGRALPRAIPAGAGPRAVVVRSNELDPGLTRSHLDNLATALDSFAFSDACSRDQACAALAPEELQLAYFYCHGRDAGGIRLEVGDADAIDPDQIVTWTVTDWTPPERHWAVISPLVILNGCHTTRLDPLSPVNFVDSFSAARASGVVGTEIALEQSMASEAAETFCSHFGGRDPLPVGEALRRTRLHFLAKGNFLGLAYTAFCSADLRLIR